ncbi:acyltransferase family protein [Collimonas pratensis]|uniref:acyltransferase family protein n=1 Tax=Collimonas pratensis TaxID=279113 RepID=UPI00143D60B2|nr:acyltransferase [Collimonas pratensis]NKI68974.1 acyltransferase family protein [Collimonas pratensis]
MEKKKTTLNNLQFLRFLASFIVVFAHAELYEFRGENVSGGFFNLGGLGVDVFFVLSGFIMVHVSQGISGNRLSASGIFFIKRLARVFPLYAFFTLLTVALSYFFVHHPFDHNLSLEQNYNAHKTDLTYIWQSLTFSNYGVVPIFSIGWTLVYEFWFYVLFAIFIASCLNVYVFFASYAVIIVTANYFGIAKVGPMNALMSVQMLEFVAGIFLYAIYNKTRSINSKAWFVFLLSLLAAFLLLAHDDPYFIVAFASDLNRRVVLWGGAAFCIVFFFLSLEGIFVPRKLFIFLGDASYSIYLTHWFCMTLIPFAFWSIGWFPKGSVAIYVFISVAIASSISVLAYVGIERPLNQYLQGKIKALTSRVKVGYQTAPG